MAEQAREQQTQLEARQTVPAAGTRQSLLERTEVSSGSAQRADERPPREKASNLPIKYPTDLCREAEQGNPRPWK